MKVIAYYILHYGKEYLNYSMQSIYYHVDEIVILYTPFPSHGTQSALTNPDSKEDLQAQVFDPDNKVAWLDGEYRNETEHRNKAMQIIKERGGEIAFLVDYDEVHTEDLPELLNIAKSNETFQTKIWMNHLWKGFDLICNDPHRQGRIFNLTVGNKNEVVINNPTPSVYHFGYAISDEVMKYKLSIHGHISEFRTYQGESWFNHKWMSEDIKDVHPTCIDMWNPEKFDKNKLPDIMKAHPRWQE